ncbi:MAG TPA: nickel-dependent lactate racemase [Sumerlaeia bacterium]|nr:nickel-dependent lactate racemase [Sumerlaeia bacterium]
MKTQLLYGSDALEIEIPENATVYASSYPQPAGPASDLALEAIRSPLGAPPLKSALRQRRPGNVVIVVSDATRPIPYAHFLNALIGEILGVGVTAREILILVATGMHRASAPAERRRMFGGDICSDYRIIDHKAEDDSELLELDGRSWAGNRIRLNRHFATAGFRIITGLVEPHFMAGFSGGRKAICPGLVSIETVRRFHGYEFLANPSARNGQLHGNPCHQEALSIARLAGADFALNVALNRDRQIVRAFAGELEASHEAACEFVRMCACPRAAFEHDIVLTSCGGHPLDATFYQCVKGMASCLPAVKNRGVIISAGGCSEGVGSPDYREMMFEYSGRWREFLQHIKTASEVRKDQWEFQMQARALEKVGPANLYFATDGLTGEEAQRLSVRGVSAEEGNVQKAVQTLLDSMLREKRSLAVIPEGPYCSPIKEERLPE